MLNNFYYLSMSSTDMDAKTNFKRSSICL